MDLFTVSVLITLVLSPAIFWALYWVSPWGRAESEERMRQRVDAEIERVLAQCETPARFPTPKE